MKTIEDLKKDSRIVIECAKLEAEYGGHAGYGYVKGKGRKTKLRFIFSDGGGWDHVSASYSFKLPSYDEMRMLKDIFFYADETAVEYHPAEKDYVNDMPYCLHIWRPNKEKLPVPPKCMV